MRPSRTPGLANCGGRASHHVDELDRGAGRAACSDGEAAGDGDVQQGVAGRGGREAGAVPAWRRRAGGLKAEGIATGVGGRGGARRLDLRRLALRRLGLRRLTLRRLGLRGWRQCGRCGRSSPATGRR